MNKGKDPLKEIIAKRYAEIKKQDAPILEKSSLEDKENKVVYVPHMEDGKHYLLAISYKLALENGHMANSSAKVLDVVPLEQKIINKVYKQQQTDLRFYFNRSKKKENK